MNFESAYSQPVHILEPEYSLGTAVALVQKRRYSEPKKINLHKKDKSQLKSNEVNPKLTTILETLNGSSLFPKIGSNRRSIEQSDDRIKLPRLLHLQRDKKNTETTGERSASIQTRQETDSIRTPEPSEKLSFSKIVAEDRQLPSRDNSELKKLIYNRNKKTVHATLNPQAYIIQQTRIGQNQEDEQEYDKDAMPGPGSYNYSYSCFEAGKRHSTQSTQVSFMSKLTRFAVNNIRTDSFVHEKAQKQELPPTKAKIEREKSILARERSRKLVPFNSNVQRNEVDVKLKERSPGPLDYSPRVSMQEDLIKKIQRHFKGTFDSGRPRFQQPESPSLLGPGSYQLPPISSDLVNTNFYFKSRQPRFL